MLDIGFENECGIAPLKSVSMNSWVDALNHQCRSHRFPFSLFPFLKEQECGSTGPSEIRIPHPPAHSTNLLSKTVNLLRVPLDFRTSIAGNEYWLEKLIQILRTHQRPIHGESTWMPCFGSSSKRAGSRYFTNFRFLESFFRGRRCRFSWKNWRRSFWSGRREKESRGRGRGSEFNDIDRIRHVVRSHCLDTREGNWSRRGKVIRMKSDKSLPYEASKGEILITGREIEK